MSENWTTFGTLVGDITLTDDVGESVRTNYSTDSMSWTGTLDMDPGSLDLLMGLFKDVPVCPCSDYGVLEDDDVIVAECPVHGEHFAAGLTTVAGGDIYLMGVKITRVRWAYEPTTDTSMGMGYMTNDRETRQVAIKVKGRVMG